MNAHARLRRILLLLPAATKASLAGKGLPLARAAELMGLKKPSDVLDDVEQVRELWQAPGEGGDTVVDLYVENGAVFVTYAQHFGQPPALSLAEGAVALAVLAPFEKDGGKPVAGAMRKLRKAVPEVLRDELAALQRGLDVPPPLGPWFGALREAIERRLETVLEYRAVADGEARRRTVEPRLLFARDGAWYLAAWNVEKGEEHLFRLDRIAQVEPGTRVFAEHRGPAVSRYGRRNLYFESGAEREVTIRYRGASARLAARRAGARPNPDGSVSVTARYTPGNYLYGYLLGLGGEAVIEGPADVAEAFGAHVAALRARYAG